MVSVRLLSLLAIAGVLFGAEAANDCQAFSGTIPGSGSIWPTWIEGPGDTVLMSWVVLFDNDNRIHLASSSDAGVNWTEFTTLDYNSGPAYFTRLSDGSLVTVAYELNAGSASFQPESVGWIRSLDDGQTWSARTFMGLTAASGANVSYGPIIETSNGRWAHTTYYQSSTSTNAQVMWSNDQGQTWGDPINFPTASDGNTGLTEVTIAQIAADKYVAAIRGDEISTIPNTWDGFYLSYSDDGLTWSVPESTGDIGRMPLFYHINDDYWALTYREYDPSDNTQYSSIRFSRDGLTWSDPNRIVSGVNTSAFLVESNDNWYLFSNTYPHRYQIVRVPIDLDAVSGMPEPTSLVLLCSGIAFAALGLPRRRSRRGNRGSEGPENREEPGN